MDGLMNVLQQAEKDAGSSVDIGAIVIQILHDLRADQSAMKEIMATRTGQIDEISKKLDAHAKESNERHEQILQAFPASDIEGHRRYHEAVIKRIEMRNDIVRECLKKASALGFIGGLVWLAKAIIFYHKGAP